MIDWGWIAGHLDDIAASIWEHVLLTVIAVGVGVVLSLMATLFVRRVPAAVGPVTFVGGVLYTIPSLALFALLVPITGFTLLTAEIGLVSYTLLILIRNMLAGLEGVVFKKPVDPERLRQAIADTVAAARARTSA